MIMMMVRWLLPGDFRRANRGKRRKQPKEEWSITFDEEEEELQRPTSRKRTRRGGHGS